MPGGIEARFEFVDDGTELLNTVSLLLDLRLINPPALTSKVRILDPPPQVERGSGPRTGSTSHMLATNCQRQWYRSGTDFDLKP